MATTTRPIDRDAALDLTRRAKTLIAELEALLVNDPDGPMLSDADRRRVEAVGESAHLHLAHLEEHGTLTLGDSLRIRRELVGADNVRSTANHFGTKDSGAILYRDVTYGTPRNDRQPVRLTVEGERLAALWRQIHKVEETTDGSN